MMKDCNYRINFTEILTYTGSLSVVSPVEIKGTITHKKRSFPLAHVMKENWSRVPCDNACKSIAKVALYYSRMEDP